VVDQERISENSGFAECVLGSLPIAERFPELKNHHGELIMDPVANMLVSVKNGYLAKKTQISVPFSKFKYEIAKVLESEKFVAKVAKDNNKIMIDLSYEGGKPKITDIKRVSKLGLRVYEKGKNIKKIKGGRGILVISTSKGLMTGQDAKEKKLGGEVICQVW